jgi:UDP-N-acetyl-D-glucosamine dehydrogenase
MSFQPGPGLGGHCIPLDPFYLSWKAREYDFTSRFIELAGEVNSHMPDHVVELAGEALNWARRSVNGSRILILGMAYKRNVSDHRESPALDIMELLKKKGAEVSYADPHVPQIRLDGSVLESVACDAKQLAAADLVIVVTDHSAFDPGLVANSAKLVLDTRNLLKDVAGTARVIRL